jgi:3-deoxy-D-manno-octulosonate 8-phosphate phosphatase (KDO 8-P phosphatase)
MKEIKLLVFDVDGCLTSGQIIYDSNGVESKFFNVKDGLAIKSAQQLGYKTAIITGRNSTIVEKRAKELQIDHLFQGIKNKLEVLENIAAQEGITLENTAAIGDDLNDYKMLKNVGLSFTPHDGAHHIRELVDIVCSEKGGFGAVREMIEHIFKMHGQMDAFLDPWQK